MKIEGVNELSTHKRKNSPFRDFFHADPKITGDFFRENRTCQRAPTLHIGERIVHFEIFSC